MIKHPAYVYLALIFLSRMAFRHRECVRATGGGAAGRTGPERLRGALFCLAPLALMQLGPLVEYVLRFKGVIGPAPSDAGFFAMMSPGNAAAGLVLFAAGTALATAASRQLARAWGEAPGTLYTGGTYAIIRHPLYAAYLGQGAGCMLMLGAAWSWALYGLAVLLILVRAAQEDRELAARFEAYQEYRRRVKRFIPGLF